MEIDRSDPNFPVLTRIKAAAMQMVVSSQIKVDEQQFRRQQESRIPALLERLAEEERKLRLTASTEA